MSAILTTNLVLLHCFTGMALHTRDAVTVFGVVARDHAQTAAVWNTVAVNL